LGKHWLGLSLAGYGIHGTTAPTSIYQFRTHGCIRLHPDDVAKLFADVTPGIPGWLIYRRVLVAKIDNQIFLEVHPDIYGKERDVVKRLADLVRHHNLAAEVDWGRAMDIIRRQEGIARAITKGAPSVNAGK
jgi:L,D-transpeptidase ErfK/SrfK